jgi:branched-chain amino acid transport system permease protein
VLLASIQQITTVTISSEFNILAVGVVLIAFVALAPDGLLGLRFLRKGAGGFRPLRKGEGADEGASAS